MMTLHPQYITDTAGKKLVILPMKEFKNMMEELEDLHDIKLYDNAKASKEASVPIDEAFKKIEAKRKKKK
jgi:PHD/YefM family antitoxin component YafN of YafNO toxin-antitoxin module